MEPGYWKRAGEGDPAAAATGNAAGFMSPRGVPLLGGVCLALFKIAVVDEFSLG